MWVSRTMAVLSLALLCTNPAVSVNLVSAQSVGKYTISLQEAIIKTIEHNPKLRVFDYQLRAQQARVQQAKLAPSPEFNVAIEDALGTGYNQGLDNAQATFSISWVLEGSIRQRYIDAAYAGSSLIEIEEDILQLDAAAETARLYLVSLAYQAREVNADKSIQFAEETIKVVSKRVKAGNTPVAELSRAQAELARRKLQREEITHDLISANRRLAAQWGITNPKFERVEGHIIRPVQVQSFETIKNQLPQNPEFARLISDQLLKKAQLQLALAEGKPAWRLNAGIRHLSGTNEQAFVAGFSIPFGESSKNPGRIAEARANLARTTSEEIAARINIETAFYMIYEQLQHSLHVIDKVSAEIIPPLEKALIETRRAYNLGRYSYLELRSVQEELLQAQNTLIEASITAHGKMIEIERLTGISPAQPK